MPDGAHFTSGNGGPGGTATIEPEVAGDLDAEASTAGGEAPDRPRRGPRRRRGEGRRLVLTPVGRGVLVGTALAYTAGWGLGYTELLVVAAAGLLAMVLALAWTWPRPRVAVDRTISP